MKAKVLRKHKPAESNSPIWLFALKCLSTEKRSGTAEMSAPVQRGRRADVLISLGCGWKVEGGVGGNKPALEAKKVNIFKVHANTQLRHLRKLQTFPHSDS